MSVSEKSINSAVSNLFSVVRNVKFLHIKSMCRKQHLLCKRGEFNVVLSLQSAFTCHRKLLVR